MKILHPGSLHIIWGGKCFCGCEFECDFKESKYQSPIGNYVRCPTQNCGKNIYFTVNYPSNGIL